MPNARWLPILACGLLASARASAQPAEPPRPAETAPPTSTTGTDLVPAEPPPPAAPPRVEAPAVDPRIHALEERLANDEKRLKELEERDRFKHLKLEGYIQPQLLVQTYNSAASPNRQANGELPPGIGANDTIPKADGTTTNGTFFRVRRARLRAFYETEVMRFFLQIDALPGGGIGPGVGTILRNAEATGIARWTRDVRTEFTAGLWMHFFRFEVPEPSFSRPFIERSWFSLNVFPLERDYGAHAKTIALDDRLVVDLGVANGQLLGQRTFIALPDLNRSKDFIANATYRIGFVTIGASGYIGRGQNVDGQNLRFKQFDKWAVNGQVRIAPKILPGVGESRLLSELTFAQNMDTGVNYAFAVPAIPNDFYAEVQNLHERALYIRFEQDVKRFLTLGYRYDMYTPNSAIKNNARDTHAGVAVWNVSKNLRWMNEIGWAIDNVHPVGAPAPSKHIVYFSSVLQAMF